jgi:hypothetical protein
MYTRLFAVAHGPAWWNPAAFKTVRDLNHLERDPTQGRKPLLPIALQRPAARAPGSPASGMIDPS